MRKLFYLFLCLFSAMFFFATESFSAEGEETPVKGVFLKSSYGAKPQIRIDDSLLETDGTSSKEFTMSVRVLFDNVDEEQLKYTNVPLFGINLKDYYGTTAMADITIENGFYTVKANKNKTSSPITGDQNNPIQVIFNEWVWLTLVVNDTEGWAKLYCNGEESSNLNYKEEVGSIFRNGEEAVFHCSNSMSYYSLPIKFDDLKIIDKALTIEEIQELQYAYSEGNIPEYIKGYYTFDETTGTVNEYPNIAGGDVVAQVIEGTLDYTGVFNYTLSTTDAMCDGWTPVYQDKETFKVNVTIEGEGTVVLKDYDGNEYQSGAAFMKDSTVFVVANPGDDYIVSEIYVDETKQTDPANVSFKITKDTEVKVLFVLKGSKVNVADENLVGGTYTCVDPETNVEYPKDATGSFYSIPYNSKVKVLATADTENGYKLKSISILIGETAQELEVANPVFTIENDEYEIKVVFVARYSLNFRVDGEGGSISVKADGQNATSGKMYDAGTEIEITVIPDDNKKLGELKINNEPVNVENNIYTIMLENNIDIIATFTDITSLENINSTKAYYDSESKVFYAGCQSVIKVYTLSGSLIQEAAGNMIDMNLINVNECIVTVSNNGKSKSFKILK